MFRKIFDRNKLKVTIISCGDAGMNIGKEMIIALKKHGAKTETMLISSKYESKEMKKLFNKRITIDEQYDGLAKNLENGVKLANKKKEAIESVLKDIVSDDENNILLITTGAGATGLGATQVLLEIFYKKYKKSPLVLTLLPELFENSRVQFNISQFLYNTVFKEPNYGNNVVLLDNKPNTREMKKPMAVVSTNRLKTMPIAFADLLFASFDEAMFEQYDAEVSDLFEVMHTPGISVFVSENVVSEDESGTVESNRIEDIIANTVIDSTSLSKEQVFDAKNAFIALFNFSQQLGLQADFEASKLYREFKQTTPYVKILGNEDSKTEDVPKVGALISGLPLPNRILQIMRLARDNKKEIMIKENTLKNQIIPMDLERIIQLEDELSK